MGGKETAEDVKEKGEAVPTTKDTGEVVAKQEDVEEDSSIKKGVGGDGGVAMGTENGSDDGQGSAVTSALDGKETASEGVTFEGVADGSQSADGKLASATGEGLLATGNVGVDDPMNKNNTTFNKVGSVADANGWSADSEDNTVADSAATDNKAACKDDPAFLYKDKPGNTCAYIGSLKPDRCSNLHNGAEIGVTSCPESCKMVEKCLAAASGGRDGVLEPAPASNATVKGEEGDLTKKEIAGDNGVAMGTENTIEVGSGDDVATTLDGEETVSEGVTFEAAADGSQSADGKIVSETSEGLEGTGNNGADDTTDKDATTFNKVGDVADVNGRSADSEDVTVAESPATDGNVSGDDASATLKGTLSTDGNEAPAEIDSALDANGGSADNQNDSE